jgi:hypothetical protein
VGSELWHELRVRVKVGQVQADGGRLENESVVMLEHRHTAERVAREMLRATALLGGHRRELVWLAELLERPCHAQRAAGVLSMDNTHHARTIPFA